MSDSDGSSPPQVIAEIGCNHAGDMALAERMVNIAANFCEAGVVKFQKRTPRALLSEEEFDAPHPNKSHAYGDTYGEHREFLEFDLDQHRHLLELCQEQGVVYSTSVWDIQAAEEIIKLEPDFIKVPSAMNTNRDLIAFLCRSYPGQIHVSLGMTSREEEDALIAQLADHDRLGAAVLYACTSDYPVRFADVSLGEITRLRDTYRGDVASIGFSGHHLGIATDIAAQALGAEWIERHFTLDRTMRGTDHAASLEPDGLRKLVRDTRAVSEAMAAKREEILPTEVETRAKLKWRQPG